MVMTVVSVEAVSAGQLTGFGSREQLLADLAEAVEPDSAPTALAIFALDGLREFVDRVGRMEGEALLAGLASRLEQAVSSDGSCYRPREDEFALLCDASDPLLELLLGRAAAALCEHGRAVPVTAALGSVVVPGEASDPIAALRLANTRLTAAQLGRQPRERRRDFRPGTQRDRPSSTAENDVASAEPLRAIHGELVEASANALRMRRLDQLLDIAGTLTTLADAVRVDDREAGTLQGRPRDSARLPLLLKELALKLAALNALKGPVIAEATKLVQEPNPLASNVNAKVLTALDEIAAAVAGCLTESHRSSTSEITSAV